MLLLQQGGELDNDEKKELVRIYNLFNDKDQIPAETALLDYYKSKPYYSECFEFCDMENVQINPDIFNLNTKGKPSQPSRINETIESNFDERHDVELFTRHISEGLTEERQNTTCTNKGTKMNLIVLILNYKLIALMNKNYLLSQIEPLMSIIHSVMYPYIFASARMEALTKKVKEGISRIMNPPEKSGGSTKEERDKENELYLKIFFLNINQKLNALNESDIKTIYENHPDKFEILGIKKTDIKTFFTAIPAGLAAFSLTVTIATLGAVGITIPPLLPLFGSISAGLVTLIYSGFTFLKRGEITKHFDNVELMRGVKKLFKSMPSVEPTQAFANKSQAVDLCLDRINRFRQDVHKYYDRYNIIFDETKNLYRVKCKTTPNFDEPNASPTKVPSEPSRAVTRNARKKAEKAEKVDDTLFEEVDVEKVKSSKGGSHKTAKKLRRKSRKTARRK